MGSNRMGPDFSLVQKLSQLINAKTFVESGTYYGRTALEAANYFDRVLTIEKSPKLHNIFAQKIREKALNSKIQALIGDSAEVLFNLSDELGEDGVVFWLDAHWSGGGTAGEEYECPLIGELTQICDRRNDIVMIDDARFFTRAPKPPHDFSQWPTLFDIANVYRNRLSEVFIQIVDDVILIVPKEQAIVTELVKISSNID